MDNIQIGYVYNLKNEINNEIIYIGSTIDIKRRFNHHKSDTYNKNSKCYHYKIYKYIREIGFENISINKEEMLIYTDRTELFKLEDTYIKKYESLNNENNAVFDKNEYYKKYKKEYVKKYRENNKEKIKKNRKEYCERNKDRIKEYNKEKIKKKKNRFLCEICNYHSYNKNNLSRHLNSNLHNKNVLKKELPFYLN